jgi:hypothetical protein
MDAPVRAEQIQLSADLRLEVVALPGAVELRLLRRTAPADVFTSTPAGFRVPVLFVPHLADVLTELATVANPSDVGGA